MTAALAALPFAAFYALPLDRSWLIAALVGPAVVAALLPVAIRRSRRILNSTKPLVDTARTLILLLTMTVLAFASTYYALETHSPGEVRGLETKTDAVYFTVTILSTVGFGDIYPAGQTARAVATLHMVSNLVLVAVSVRLVTWAARRRADGTRLLSEAPTPPRPEDSG
jgi:voltage-gated potassium channel